MNDTFIPILELKDKPQWWLEKNKDKTKNEKTKKGKHKK